MYIEKQNVYRNKMYIEKPPYLPQATTRPKGSQKRAIDGREGLNAVIARVCD
jgi:hypothetical protein